PHRRRRLRRPVPRPPARPARRPRTAERVLDTRRSWVSSGALAAKAPVGRRVHLVPCRTHPVRCRVPRWGSVARPMRGVRSAVHSPAALGSAKNSLVHWCDAIPDRYADTKPEGRSRRTARGRALAILTGLAVFVAGWVVFVSAWSGPAGAGPGSRGAGFAAARATDLDAFRKELLVWAPGGFSEREVGRVRDSTRVAAISAVRTGTLPAASGRRGGYRVVPVETMGVDTNAYTAAAGKPGRKLATLLPKGAVLSKTGAKLRRVKSGGKLRLTGNRAVTVSGVV